MKDMVIYCSALLLTSSATVYAGLLNFKIIHKTNNRKVAITIASSIVLTAIILSASSPSLITYILTLLVAWLIRRPIRGIRGHLWGIASVPMVPAIMLIAGIVRGKASTIESLPNSAFLLCIAVTILLVDQVAELQANQRADQEQSQT